jgi:hypothetical protein
MPRDPMFLNGTRRHESRARRAESLIGHVDAPRGRLWRDCAAKATSPQATRGESQCTTIEVRPLRKSGAWSVNGMVRALLSGPIRTAMRADSHPISIRIRAQS